MKNQLEMKKIQMGEFYILSRKNIKLGIVTLFKKKKSVFCHLLLYNKYIHKD